MSEPLRVGVTGLGLRGFGLAHRIREECPEELAVVAMADIQPAMLDLARERFPQVELYNSNEQMAREADIDAIIIVTGDRYHAINAREALQNGKHVLIEKPMAQSYEDLITIASLQKQTGLVVGSFLEMRQNPNFKRAKEIVDSGELGRVLAGSVVCHLGRDNIQFFSRRRTRTREVIVSLVLQKGVHPLDLLNWFMGESPCRVGAVGGLLYFGGDEPADKSCPSCDRKSTCPHVASVREWRIPQIDLVLQNEEDACVWSESIDVEDVSFLNLAYTGGLVGNYTEIHFAPYYAEHFTLYGDKAQMDIEVNYDTNSSYVEITERFTRRQRRERPSRDCGHAGADVGLMVDFAHAIREGRQPISDVRAGFESAAIGIATRESIDTGQFITLPMLDDV